MLREGCVHTDWCEMTMSMIREKQFEACERRLFAQPRMSLFSSKVTEMDAQSLFEASFDYVQQKQGEQKIVTLQELRGQVMLRLPLEAVYLSIGEMELLERLLINDGELLLSDWDDIGAAEALVRRMWCGCRADGDDWWLLLPEPLHAPLLQAIGVPNIAETRERLFRFDATIHGLLYITGLLHSSQPIAIFLHEVMKRDDVMSLHIAQRYLQASFEYMTDANGELVLLHPGLADPYRLVNVHPVDSVFCMELSQELIAGAMQGLLPEEALLHDTMCGVLVGALRPEIDIREAAEDLRMLAKQGVSFTEMENVMASMLAVLPTPLMKDALRNLYQYTPHWMGLKTAVMQ